MATLIHPIHPYDRIVKIFDRRSFYFFGTYQSQRSLRLWLQVGRILCCFWHGFFESIGHRSCHCNLCFGSRLGHGFVGWLEDQSGYLVVVRLGGLLYFFDFLVGLVQGRNRLRLFWGFYEINPLAEFFQGRGPAWDDIDLVLSTIAHSAPGPCHPGNQHGGFDGHRSNSLVVLYLE